MLKSARLSPAKATISCSRRVIAPLTRIPKPSLYAGQKARRNRRAPLRPTPEFKAEAVRQVVERAIYLVRDEKIILDQDLAALYEVETKALVQGVAMLSGVLRSERAVSVNIEIMRAFVRLRRLLLTHEVLAKKLASIERKYDEQFKVIFDAIRTIMAPEAPSKHRRIGFRPRKD